MRIGILGHGSIGKRHYANIKAAGHEVEWYDPTEKYQSNFRENLIAASDAIIICSPSECHDQDIEDVIQRDKHLLCEKPFGYRDHAKLGYLVSKARNEIPTTIMATGFNLRFHHCVIKAKELIPELGDISFSSFTVNQKTEKPVYLRDGIIRNWCSHELDLANHLLGPGGKVVNCTIDGENGEDTSAAVISLKYPSVKEHVFIQADYFSDPEQRHFCIDGSKAMLGVDLVKRNVFMHDKKTGRKSQVLAATDTFDQNYIDEMKCFLASINAWTHVAPLATAEDGIVALRQVMDARWKAGLK